LKIKISKLKLINQKKSLNIKTLKLEKDLILLKNLRNSETSLFKVNKKKLNNLLNYILKSWKKKQTCLDLLLKKKLRVKKNKMKNLKRKNSELKEIYMKYKWIDSFLI
jgi:oligoribonuclease NrnB/cAMP/cGMP phosphodiesterase (DHH superfamily)